MIFLLAIKNVIKNKKDSLIVIFLISVITFLFFIGNTIIGKASTSLRSSFIESLTGDVVIQKKGEISMNLFSANVAIIETYFEMPVLPAYNEVLELLKKEDKIAQITSQVSGTAYLDFNYTREPALLCGVDPLTYFSLFPGIILLEGSLLQPGEFGAMITQERAERIEEKSGKKPQIGDPMLFTTGGGAGFKIREVPLTGIYKYTNPGQFMNEIIIIDPQTVRDLNSIISTQYISEDEASSDLFSNDIDSFFSISEDIDYSQEDTGFSSDYLMQFLGEAETEKTSITSGDWHFILIRLNKGVSAKRFISSVNKKLTDMEVTAVDWRIASGTSSILALIIQFLFNCGIILISITGIIAVINIYLIYVFRRVREIGTLRAIGSNDSFIRTLIYCENLIYSIIAGLLGIIGGAAFLKFINNRQITISNDILVTLFNGTRLYFNFLSDVALLSFLVALALGLIATIYPVETAVRIKPVVAVRRG